MTPEAHLVTLTGADLREHHIRTIGHMDEDQRLVMAREVLVAMMIAEASKQGRDLTRKTALAAIFASEAQAMNQGRVAVINFFLPIDQDLPLAVDKQREVPAHADA